MLRSEGGIQSSEFTTEPESKDLEGFLLRLKRTQRCKLKASLIPGKGCQWQWSLS